MNQKPTYLVLNYVDHDFTGCTDRDAAKKAAAEKINGGTPSSGILIAEVDADKIKSVDELNDQDPNPVDIE